MSNEKRPRPQTRRDGRTHFSRYRRLKNGRVLDAYAYGYKAWPMKFRVRT